MTRFATRPARIAFGLAALLALNAGCSDDEGASTASNGSGTVSGGGGGAPGGGGGGSAGSANGGAGAEGGGAPDDAGNDQSDGVLDELNGCTNAAAVDHAADAAVLVQFGGQFQFAYDEPCIKIKPGTEVTFQGDGETFSDHPLHGGTVDGNRPMPDPSSPLTYSGTDLSKTFTLAAPGIFPYYCELHYSAKMYGVVYVEP